MSDGITQVNDWHRIATLQRKVNDLEITVAKLEQQLSGKQPMAEVPPVIQRSVLRRIAASFRRKP